MRSSSEVLGALNERALIWLAALVLAGCSSLPTPMPRQATGVLQVSATESPLVRIATEALPADAASGFRLLPLGKFALDARLELIRRATRTLDLQVYYFANDTTGMAVARALRDAAERGVRVRLLIDDANTTSAEALIAELADVPGLQVRLFNPFCCLRGSLPGRILSSLNDLHRLQYRMHNKLMIADGTIAIVGGRNIADEYFDRSDHANFLDLDAIMVGRVVPQLGGLFDKYWNNDLSIAVEQLRRTGTGRPAPAQAASPSGIARADSSAPDLHLPQVDMFGRGPVSAELQAGRLSLTSGVAYAVADDPLKLEEDPEQLADTGVLTGAVFLMLGTRRELATASPYLVPGTRGMRMLQSLSIKGVDVTMVTNSLRASDSRFAYFGYSRYRKEMIATGISLYEVRSSPSRAGTGFATSMARLHTKLLVLDRESVVLGSLNLDPRSARRNTELAVAVQSESLALEAQRVIDQLKSNAYQVSLDDRDGSLEWVDSGAADGTPSGQEPGASLLTWLDWLLFNPFVPEELL